MNKKIVIPIAIGLLIAAIVVANISGGGNKVFLEWKAISSKSEAVDSIELKVYVENSGSMDGYMCDGSNLKDAVFDYVSDLKKYSDATSLFYINSNIIPRKTSLEDYIQNLTPNSFAKAGGDRANTDLRKIFDMILQNHKRNAITVFVSDCILDIPQNALNFFGNCQVSIKNSFYNILKTNPCLGVQILKLQSKFNGYWYCGKNKELLNNVKRPYYIWVIGDKQILAKINKGVPYKNIIGGVESYCAFSNPDIIPFDISKKNYVINHTNKIYVDILANLSSSLQTENVLTDCNNYSTSKPTQTKVVSAKRITTSGSKYSHVIKLEIENPHSLNFETVTIHFPSMPSWVNATNDDTGENVTQNLDKTTGIYYLINGVSEAYNTAAPYGKISFRIKK